MRRNHLGLAVLAGLAAVSTVSCSSCTRRATGEDLTIAPKDAHIVVAVNLARMRNTAMWRKLLDVRDGSAENKKKYDEFVARCGFDPMTQIESALFAFPPPFASDGEFGVIVHGNLDEQKLIACAKGEAQRAGRELTITEHDGKKLYADPENGTMRGAILDGKTVVIGGPKWTEKMIDLAAGKAPGESAKENSPLGELIKRSRATDAVWGVGIVSDAMRTKLEDMPQLSVAKSMKSLVGSIDFATGLRVDLVVDLASEADAKELAEKMGQQLGDAKKSPKVMITGLSSMMDAVKVSSEGASFKVTVGLTQTQVEDLIQRFEGLIKNSLGGASIRQGDPEAAPPQF